MSLIEGMISMAVLAIGILGALQGTLYASRQNSVAERLERATSMAAQIRLGLESQGRARLMATTGGALGDSTYCKSMASATALYPLIDNQSATTVAGACVLDVDAYDSNGAVTLPNKLASRYSLAADYAAGAGLFRRLVVFLPGTGGVADTAEVIVSTKDGLRRVFIKQVVGLYDSSATTGNKTLVDL